MKHIYRTVYINSEKDLEEVEQLLEKMWQVERSGLFSVTLCKQMKGNEFDDFLTTLEV